MNPVELAKMTVEKYVTKQEIPDMPEKIFVEVEQAGVFVSIKTADGDLRGCIGTIFPTEDHIGQEIINNAVKAATKDPRFDEIQHHELENLNYSVDVLHKPERVTSEEELDPKNYGIIVVAKDGKQALLLPDLEGIETIQQQLAVCKRKAGIPMNEPIAVHRFKADRYYE